MIERLPTATPVSEGFDRLIAWMTGLSRRTARTVSVAAALVLCLAEVVAGPHLSLAALGLLPIAFSAWTLGVPAGLAIAAITSGTAVLVAGPVPAFAPSHEAHGFAAAWNVGMRVFANAFNVMLVAGFRRTFDLERWRARHDALTGAMNKQVFLAHLDQSMAAMTAAGRVLALAYLDLDGFKQVNDRFGHLAGDEVLARFAHGAAALLRSGDCFARFGGDEFVVLASAESADEAFRAIESIHFRLTRLLRELPYGVTCSTGAVVLADAKRLDRTGFIQLADELMYEVKRSGRNALRMAHAEAMPEQADAGREAA